MDNSRLEDADSGEKREVAPFWARATICALAYIAAVILFFVAAGTFPVPDPLLDITAQVLFFPGWLIAFVGSLPSPQIEMAAFAINCVSWGSVFAFLLKNRFPPPVSQSSSFSLRSLFMLMTALALILGGLSFLLK